MSTLWGPRNPSNEHRRHNWIILVTTVQFGIHALFGISLQNPDEELVQMKMKILKMVLAHICQSLLLTYGLGSVVIYEIYLQVLLL